MKHLTLDQFLARSKEIIIEAAAGETGTIVSVPGAASAVIISIQEYERLIGDRDGEEKA